MIDYMHILDLFGDRLVVGGLVFRLIDFLETTYTEDMDLLTYCVHDKHAKTGNEMDMLLILATKGEKEI